MEPENTIKSITEHTCPSCGVEIYVENQMVPPIVGALFTKDDVKMAKENCLTIINGMDLPEDKLESVVKWINDPETVFGPGEVESIIASLSKIE